MKPFPIALAVALFAVACSGKTPANNQDVAKARQDAGTALVTLAPPSSDGERLFQANCAICHADGKLYPGTVKLRQNGQPVPALAKRTDLDAEYVRLVARNGLNTMPAFSPTHLTDADIDKIARYLARGTGQ